MAYQLKKLTYLHAAMDLNSIGVSCRCLANGRFSESPLAFYGDLDTKYIWMIYKFYCTCKRMSRSQYSVCKCDVKFIGSRVCKNQSFI
jgi:hypothetical protein